MNQGDNNGGAVAGSFTMSAQLPNGKSLTFSGYILQGEVLADINEKLDIASAVVERQRLAAEIPVLEKTMEQQIKNKSQVESIVEELSGKMHQTTQDKQQLKTMQVNLRSIDDDIRKGEIAISDARRALVA